MGTHKGTSINDTMWKECITLDVYSTWRMCRYVVLEHENYLYYEVERYTIDEDSCDETLDNIHSIHGD